MTREETIEKLQSIIEEDKNSLLSRVHVGFLIHAVKYLKEQQEIVRCKDCKWFSEKGFCKHPDGGAANIRPADWFCADGERR